MRKQHVLVFALLLSAVSALAQQGTGSLTGMVVDPGGAAVPGAAVTLTNIDLKDKREFVTQPSGQFRFQALNPGTYQLQVSMSGFKAVTMGDIALLSSENRDLGTISMQIGSVNESVTVTAEATPVQTSSSERAASVTSDQIENLSLKGRDPFGLLHMLPGVVDSNTNRNATDVFSSGGISINGIGSNGITPAIDGAPVQHLAATGNVLVVPNLEAIGEVRVVSSGSQAEFGRNSGATVNFVTKGGTSQLHGAFHWDHRNESLNANEFLLNRTGLPRPIYRHLILGGSIGGPVNIPKIMPSVLKNRIFFFYSPEYTTSKRPTVTSIVNAPTAAELSGDFSKTFYATNAAPTVGVPLIVIDPLTGKQFPDNKIPANRINSTGLALLKLLPTPNGYLSPVTPFNANAAYSATPGFTRWDHVVRMDTTITKSLNAYYRAVVNRTTTGNVNTVTAGKGAYDTLQPDANHSAHAAWVIKPTLINETQFAFAYFFFGSPGHTDAPDSTYFRTATLNPPQLFSHAGNTEVGPTGYPLYPNWLPILAFTGGNYQGYAGFTPNPSQTIYENGDRSYTFRDDLTYIRGGHTFKFGFNYEHGSDYDTPGSANAFGNYNFGSTAQNPFDSGNGYANALLGNFQQYTQTSRRSVQGRHFIALEGYIQDNWKVSKRLTLDLGVRFMHQSPTYDDSQYTAQFFPSLFNPANASRLYVPACKVAGATCSAANQYALDPVTGATNISNYIAAPIPGVGNLYNGLKTPVEHGLSYPAIAVQPRLGFAWNVNGDGKTVLRGSGGIFNNRGSLNNLIGQNSPPVAISPTVFYGSFDTLAAQGSSALVPVNNGAVGREIPYDTVYQYNLTFEKDIHFNTVVSAGYVATFDRHAQSTTTENNIPFGSFALQKNLFNQTPISANLLRTQYPGVGSITTYCGCLSTLNYHALQTTITHRLQKGLTFSANYTFSKALGSSGADIYHTGQPIPTAYGGTVTFPTARQWFYGPTGNDRRHYAGANMTYQIPTLKAFGPVGRQALGGWSLSSILSISSGAAVSPTCGSTASFPTNDPTWTGAGGVRCQVVGDWKNFTQNFDNNFNKAAFVYPNGGTAAAPTPTFGNAGLGIMRQPSWWNQDVTVAKNFALGGERTRRSAEIQLQMYNVYNHTEFNQIGTTYSFNGTGANTNLQTGQFTGTQSPRQMVITARFNF